MIEWKKVIFGDTVIMCQHNTDLKAVILGRHNGMVWIEFADNGGQKLYLEKNMENWAVLEWVDVSHKCRFVPVDGGFVLSYKGGILTKHNKIFKVDIEGQRVYRLAVPDAE